MSEIADTEDQLLARHKKETKDLIATITGLKKQASKSKRKEVNKRCLDMELTLKEKHEKELKNFRVENGEEDAEDEITPEMLLAQLELEQKEDQATTTRTKPEQSNQPEQPKVKRNRQKERLLKRQAEIDAKRAEAEAEASEQPNLKEIEQEHIDHLCQLNSLVQFDIQPDGNCLFASIADQLSQRKGVSLSVQELRTKACNHIRGDPDTYTPYLFDEETMSMKDLKEYTEKIEKTSAWGSDLEILALSKEFDCPISVMMSGRSTLKINPDGKNEELKLVYYKHSYSLGEHYNSLRDA